MHSLLQKMQVMLVPLSSLLFYPLPCPCCIPGAVLLSRARWPAFRAVRRRVCLSVPALTWWLYLAQWLTFLFYVPL